MRTITIHPIVSSPARGAAMRRLRLSRRVVVLTGLAVIFAALAVAFANQPPGAAIRSDLAAGAALVRALPATAPREEVTQALQRRFHGRTVTVDAEAFPAVVDVTLRALDRQSCVEAEAFARRLEGKVVVELDGYPRISDCRDSNDMTWRIMP